VYPFADVPLQPVPAIVIEIKHRAFGKEQQRIIDHAFLEDDRQVAKQMRVKDDQREQQKPAQDRGKRVGGDRDLDELIGHIIITLVTGAHADGFDDENKDRHRQNKGRKP